MSAAPTLDLAAVKARQQATWASGDFARVATLIVPMAEILCDAADKTCDMSQADVMSMDGTPWLSVYQQSFRITKLDAQSMLAEPSLPDLCIRQTLSFDRVAKAVTLVRTKISREYTCALVQDEPLTLFLGEPL